MEPEKLPEWKNIWTDIIFVLVIITILTAISSCFLPNAILYSNEIIQKAQAKGIPTGLITCFKVTSTWIVSTFFALAFVSLGLYINFRKKDGKSARDFVMWLWCIGLGLVPMALAIFLWICVLKGGLEGG
ncbi:MAG: hypothetical protein K8T10_17340 [Candidatus Eremiobacteraeota bacterium]|nr:hypothetical protein [Candidatus Eremiobacteraeota bacterium]